MSRNNVKSQNVTCTVRPTPRATITHTEQCAVALSCTAWRQRVRVAPSTHAGELPTPASLRTRPAAALTRAESASQLRQVQVPVILNAARGVTAVWAGMT